MERRPRDVVYLDKENYLNLTPINSLELKSNFNSPFFLRSALPDIDQERKFRKQNINFDVLNKLAKDPDGVDSNCDVLNSIKHSLYKTREKLHGYWNDGRQVLRCDLINATPILDDLEHTMPFNDPNSSDYYAYETLDNTIEDLFRKLDKLEIKLKNQKNVAKYNKKKYFNKSTQCISCELIAIVRSSFVEKRSEEVPPAKKNGRPYEDFFPGCHATWAPMKIPKNRYKNLRSKKVVPYPQLTERRKEKSSKTLLLYKHSDLKINNAVLSKSVAILTSNTLLKDIEGNKVEYSQKPAEMDVMENKKPEKKPLVMRSSFIKKRNEDSKICPTEKKKSSIPKRMPIGCAKKGTARHRAKNASIAVFSDVTLELV